MVIQNSWCVGIGFVRVNRICAGILGIISGGGNKRNVNHLSFKTKKIRNVQTIVGLHAVLFWVCDNLPCYQLFGLDLFVRKF